MQLKLKCSLMDLDVAVPVGVSYKEIHLIRNDYTSLQVLQKHFKNQEHLKSQLKFCVNMLSKCSLSRVLKPSIFPSSFHNLLVLLKNNSHS